VGEGSGRREWEEGVGGGSGRSSATSEMLKEKKCDVSQ
jgi:hypothetical protein